LNRETTAAAEIQQQQKWCQQQGQQRRLQQLLNFHRESRKIELKHKKYMKNAVNRYSNLTFRYIGKKNLPPPAFKLVYDIAS
jgi:ABC-type bacteriocin/lantibiotic exporter with double-glycine peptidase domain